MKLAHLVYATCTHIQRSDGKGQDLFLTDQRMDRPTILMRQRSTLSFVIRYGKKKITTMLKIGDSPLFIYLIPSAATFDSYRAVINPYDMLQIYHLSRRKIININHVLLSCSTKKLSNSTLSEF